MPSHEHWATFNCGVETAFTTNTLNEHFPSNDWATCLLLLGTVWCIVGSKTAQGGAWPTTLPYINKHFYSTIREGNHSRVTQAQFLQPRHLTGWESFTEHHIQDTQTLSYSTSAQTLSYSTSASSKATIQESREHSSSGLDTLLAGNHLQNIL